MEPAIDPAETDIPDPLRWAILCFSVDRITAEVTAAFNAASIQNILLKGPTIATWLYTADEPRLYSDSDFLVQKQDWPRVREVLEGMGFEDDLSDLAHPRMESGAGYPWGRRSDAASVDLHYTLFGLGAKPEEIWDTFIADAKLDVVGGTSVHVLSRPARLLHIALHAVQHGGEAQPRPMMDLQLAIAKAPPGLWAEARDLAARLDAKETFTAGLRLTGDGRELADSIGAAASNSVDTTLRLEPVPLAEGFHELAETSGLRLKAKMVLRELFPKKAFMRWWTPLAKRGPLGLTAAYAWRVIYLAFRAIPGYLAWRRASRRSADS